MAVDPLTLLVDGARYGGWKDVKVTRGIERAAASFDLSVSEHWPGIRDRWRIPEGALCELYIGADKVITGYVDKVEASYDKGKHAVRVSGRSKTADLIDCSAIVEGGQLLKLRIDEIARRLAAPFGVEIDMRADAGAPFPSVQVQNGETVWKLVERLARQRELLVFDDAEGRLVLGHLLDDRASDVLKHPAHGLLQITGGRDMKQRFSDYIVKGQAPALWADFEGEGTPEQLAHVQGGFRDLGVPRYRPKLIVAEGATSVGTVSAGAGKPGTGAMGRAEWDARRRIGKSITVKVKRAGWRQSDGALWQPNMLVHCELPFMDLSDDLGIGEVTWTLDASGTTCEMTLHPPEAFTPEPAKEPAGGAGDGGGGQYSDFLKNAGVIPGKG
jgi:prophage tail gpP-like protein